MVVVQDHLKQGGADYVYRVEVTPVKPVLTLGLSERSQFADIVAPVPQRQPHGVSGQCVAGRFRRRSESRIQGSAARHDGRNAADAGQSRRRAGAAHGRGRRAAGRSAGRRHRPPCRSESKDRRTFAAADVADSRAEQHRGLESIQRAPGRCSDAGSAVQNRDRRAQGAAGSRRGDEFENRGHAGRGLQGPDRRADALQPAGRRLIRVDCHSRRPERGGDSADRQQRARKC